MVSWTWTHTLDIYSNSNKLSAIKKRENVNLRCKKDKKKLSRKSQKRHQTILIKLLKKNEIKLYKRQKFVRKISKKLLMGTLQCPLTQPIEKI